MMPKFLAWGAGWVMVKMTETRRGHRKKSKFGAEI